MSFLFPSSTITFEAALRDVAAGSPKARAMAAHALGDVTEPTEKRRAVDALVRALGDDRPEVRAEACNSLGSLGEPGAIAHLIKRLTDGAPAVRQSAAIALGSLGGAEAFEPLVEQLANGPADVRFQAATSLAELDPARAFEHELKALADKDAQVAGAAALAVGAIAAELDRPELRAQALAALHAALEAHEPAARFDIAYALAELRDPAGRSTLAGATSDRDRAWDAVTALGWLNASAELQGALVSKKTPPEAQVLAAGKLLALDHATDAARRVLLEALANRKEYIRALAVEQIAESGGAWAKEPLEKLARSGKGGDLLEAIAAALRSIEERAA